MIRPWKLLECNWGYIKQQCFEVAVIPFGATEPHNLHLPYGADVLEADAIGEAVCRYAFERGAKVVLLPTVPYGTETNQREFALSINVDPSTLFALATDLIESLAGHGIRKIMILNSHGGNEFKPLLRELYGKVDASLFLCNWYQAIRDVYDDIFDAPEDHAGEMETSFLLAYYPELVDRDDAGRFTADEGARASTRFEALNQGWVSITRPWHLLTTNAGAGNPHAATADKGRRLMEVLEQRIGGFLVELSAAERDARFPY